MAGKSIAPYLVVDDANAAIAWYEKALGATKIDVSYVPDSEKVMNAQLMLGSTLFMLNDEFPDYGSVGPKKMGGSCVTMHINSDDVDVDWNRIVDAGGEVVMPLDDMFWGMRYGMFKDPFGHKWSIGQQTSNPTKEEMVAAMKSM
ncbi:MAG: VOC family protein [Armatimonadetes bacterium]|nr:VOC family protein [Armatimonadota bacterium]